MEEIKEVKASNFIWDAIEEDLAAGNYTSVHTRFPPEPNGYLHIGHCKALVIDFGTAKKFGGLCNLRMDDTNPAKEDTEYVDAIKEDIHWLGAYMLCETKFVQLPPIPRKLPKTGFCPKAYFLA